MPDISTEKVCYVIVKARELEAEDEGVPADASNPTDDQFVSVLTEEGFSTFRQEAAAFIEAMDVDEQSELVALVWVGRGDFSGEEWADAVTQARERRLSPTSDYLLGIPLLASHLEAGLAEFGESCAEYEADRQ